MPKSARWFALVLMLLVALIMETRPGMGANPAPVWPSPPARARIQFVKVISSLKDLGGKPSLWERFLNLVAGEAPERLVTPHGLAVFENRLYIADSDGHAVWEFDMARPAVHRWDIGEHFLTPIGIAVDQKGKVFVSDSGRGSVFVLSPEGRLLKAIRGENLFVRPTGLAVDRARQKLYVVDTAGNRITVLDTESYKLVTIFGRRGDKPGEFNYPVHAFVRNDRLYVSDSLNFRVQVFTLDGRFESSFGRMGDGSGDFARPKGVAVDSAGHIYVVDALFDRVQIFDRDGRLLLPFGESGQGLGEFWLPTGIYIDEKDRIFVADSSNRRVEVFQYLQ
ncbi:MAG: 6-bladed beta-propeller [Firmicutes bacterium]|nr:6-bladed beta-propeller [Bacillota bacterium]